MAGSHCWPLGQPDSQRPPQPSLDPQGESSVHVVMHVHVKASGSHRPMVPGHTPMHWPPQPSSAPHAPPAAQLRSHWHWPTTQRSRGDRVHGGSHVHVSMQRPSTQSAPGAHVTPAHGLGMQRPSAQISVAAHITPSQLDRGRHCTWQA